MIGAALLVLGTSAGAAIAQEESEVQLDQLIRQFDDGAPPIPGSAHLDAWVEHAGGGMEVVIVVTPEGETKLIADPGISVTPTVTGEVDWLVPMPHRLVDPSTEYFQPPATIRLPYADHRTGSVELFVEYAYCVVDFQCFFGEETLTVALDTP